MNVSTLTRNTDLFDLSQIINNVYSTHDSGGLAHEDLVFPNRNGFRDYLERDYLTACLKGLNAAMLPGAEDRTSGRRYQWTLEAAQTFNEASIENAHHDALAEKWTRDYLSTPVVVPPVESRQSQANALAAMRRREAQAIEELTAIKLERAKLQGRITELSEPVTRGNDERLVEFWNLAADAANEAGFCPEYDRIAEAMGGVSREDMTIDYTVDLQIVANVSVNISLPRGADVDIDAISNAYTRSDIEGLIDVSWGDIEVTNYDED